MQIRCSNCFHEYDEAFGLCPNCGYVEGEEYAEAYCLAPGTRITDRYIIGETLGLGGFGITYKAWDIQLNTALAIKEYFPCGLVNRTAGDSTVFLVSSKRAEEFEYGKSRFLDEARNMVKFSRHHNIVNVFNYFEANNTAYIVMEFLDGMTLSQTLQTQNGPLPVSQCVSIAIDICDALESIHKEGILHRDVSPDNIMLCKDGTVKLFDFGAARFSKEATEDSKVTVIVKPGFAPPEQYDNFNQQDVRTDLYALGATLYYAMTGVKPDESTNRKIKDELQPPKVLAPEIPTFFNNAIMRAMALEPHFRFASMEEFRRILQRKIEVGSVEQERKKKIRRRLVGIGAALVVIAVAFVTFGWGWKRQEIPAGNVELWYISTGDTAMDKNEAAVWDSVAEMFSQDYPGTKLTAVGFAEDVYIEKIAEAQKNGTMPDIYESTILPDSLLQDATSLESVLSAEHSACFDGLEGRDTQYPTGMIVPVIYVNRSISQTRDTADFAAMAATCEDVGLSLAISTEAADLYEKLYKVDLNAYVSEDALELYINGKSPIYLGTSADFPIAETIVRKGNGTYDILFPQTGEAAYMYGCLWSCSDMDENTTRIAHAVLKYLNSDRTQDYFNIRNFSQSKCVPVTQSAIEKYIEAGFTALKDITAFLDLPYVQ